MLITPITQLSNALVYLYTKLYTCVQNDKYSKLYEIIHVVYIYYILNIFIHKYTCIKLYFLHCTKIVYTKRVQKYKFSLYKIYTKSCIQFICITPYESLAEHLGRRFDTICHRRENRCQRSHDTISARHLAADSAAPRRSPPLSALSAPIRRRRSLI